MTGRLIATAALALLATSAFGKIDPTPAREDLTAHVAGFLERAPQTASCVAPEPEGGDGQLLLGKPDFGPWDDYRAAPAETELAESPRASRLC